VEDEERLRTEGYRWAVELLRACTVDAGFVATTVDTANSHRIWGRGTGIMGLAALATEEADLVDAFRRGA
jgi:hypothetical protein